MTYKEEYELLQDQLKTTTACWLQKEIYKKRKKIESISPEHIAETIGMIQCKYIIDPTEEDIQLMLDEINIKIANATVGLIKRRSELENYLADPESYPLPNTSFVDKLSNPSLLAIMRAEYELDMSILEQINIATMRAELEQELVDLKDAHEEEHPECIGLPLCTHLDDDPLNNT